MNGKWIIVGMLGVVIAGVAIAQGKLIYLAVLSAPLLIYLSIARPFLFPLGAYFFLVPFDQLLSLGDVGGLTLTKVLGMYAIPMLLVKGSFEDKMQVPAGAVWWWIALVLYGALSALWAIQPETAVARISTAGGLMLLYLMVASYKIQKHEVDVLKWCITAGGIFAAALTINDFRSVGLAARVTVQIGDRAAGLNGLAFDLLLPAAVCIGMMTGGKRMLRKITFAVMLGIIIFAVIITGSRGGLVGLSVVAIVYVLSTRQKISVGVVLFVVGIMLAAATPVYFIERIEQSVETGGSGRIVIWINGLKALKNYWLTGAGLNNFPVAYTELAHFTPFSEGLGRASHNVYLGIFVELGIMGFVLMMWGIWAHYKAIRSGFHHPGGDQIMLKAALLGMLASSFFLDTFWYKSFWILWMMIVMNNSVARGERDNLLAASPAVRI